MYKYIIRTRIFKACFIFCILFSFFSCRKVTVGYLITESAGYEIDSMAVKSVLDITPPVVIPNPLYEMYLGFGFPPDLLLEIGIYPTIEEGGGEDYKRHKLGQPWTSTSIEGILGTPPIIASVKNITSTNGDPAKLLSVLTIRSNGILTVPLSHNVPPGQYKISLTFSNEGYSKDLDDVFTVIVR